MPHDSLMTDEERHQGKILQLGQPWLGGGRGPLTAASNSRPQQQQEPP
jgi:hypothetical protein